MILLSEENQLVIDKLSDVELRFLEEMIGYSDVDKSDAGKARLYANPYGESIKYENENSDWEEYVLPSIENKFKEDRDVVKDSLKNVKKTTNESEEFQYKIEIEKGEVLRWYSVLNQARIRLYEEENIPDGEIQEVLDDLLIDTEDNNLNTREVAQEQLEVILKYEMCGVIQDWMISELA